MTICATCATAADHLAAVIVSVGLDQVAPGSANIARMYHDQCHGCDCQHNVDAQLSGKAIQR